MTRIVRIVAYTAAGVVVIPLAGIIAIIALAAIFGGEADEPEATETAAVEPEPQPEPAPAPPVATRTPAERGQSFAEVYCVEPIERLTRFAFRWTDGFLGYKFPGSLRPDGDVVTYFGDEIEVQNAFGAWQVHTYECDVDVVAERVLDVRAAPGRLP